MLRLEWINSLWYKSPADGLFLLKHYAWVRRHTRELLSRLDVEAFERIGRNLEHRNFNRLYLNLEQTLTVSLYRLRRLGLDQGPPVRLLDIATGPGVFPYVCRQFGHDVVCSDVDTTPYYNELARFFELDRRVWEVVRGVPAPDFGRTFDLVTATNVGFNSVRDRADGSRLRTWTSEEWDFFLTDLATRVVTERGRIYITINQLQRRKPDPARPWRYSDPGLLSHFAHRGAVFPSHGHVLFTDVPRLIATGAPGGAATFVDIAAAR